MTHMARKCKFAGTAKNAAGLTFQFVFYNPNWNGAQEAAENALRAAVAADPMHQANGPWIVVRYEICA